MNLLSNKLFDFFVINQRYFAVQKSGFYHAKNQYVNIKTIENMLKNKSSFLCYQEDYNYIKWICFDFDINKDIVDEKELFNQQKEELYQELISSINELLTFLDTKEIDYLVEFSGNRGIHIWILFDDRITRQDGYIIFKSILDQAQINLDTSKYSLDKYPKSLYSKVNTDKGIGVKIPLSFHQKSKKYSRLLKDIKSLDFASIEIDELQDEDISSQLLILDNYNKQNKNILFEKLVISKEKIKEEQEKHNFLNSTKISFSNTDLTQIIDKLNSCEHLKNIFLKKLPNDQERRIIVGLLGQLKNNNNNIGKELLYDYFMSKDNAIETIIKQRLVHSNRYAPPTCEYFRGLYNSDCKCNQIEQTPLEFLDDFSYEPKEIFELNEELFYDIKKSQIRYSKQNDEILPFHTLNNLNKYDYQLLKYDIEEFKRNSFVFESYYEYIRAESKKERKLYSISARDKIITTFAIKILDSIFYKNFSAHSFGYKFNPSFRQNDIFEHWLKQWNMYIKELKTLIYSEDFKEYYILKLDLKSFYSSINLQKLQIELNQNIEHNYDSGMIKDEEKQTYFEIINNLISFSKQITKNDSKGLPQGPAYARYLAEYHLTSLDHIVSNIIKNKGFYYRYVDDMFIIMPTKDDIDLVEQEIIEHLATKALSINDEKTYKGMINSFKTAFEDYVDNTKYFIDTVSRNQSINTQTTVHQASAKLLELIKDDEGKVNDNNLTFLFTHLDNSKQIIEKKEELEEYIINDAKGRGSFFNIFWKYYFNKYDFESINFDLFKNLTKLKRECFLNSLLIVLNSNNLLSNETLKALLDFYITTSLSNIEKLSLLEIYSIDDKLFNEMILKKVGIDIEIYNDLILSHFSKKIPLPIIEAIEKSFLEQSHEKQFNYLYNLLFYSENDDTSIIQKFSKIFIETVNTILNGNTKRVLPYLDNNTNLLKYIQIVYITTLYSKFDKAEYFEASIYSIWQNLFWNVNKNESINESIVSKLSYWKSKLENISLEDSNIHFLLPLIKEHNYKLMNGFSDRLKLVDNYFNFLIELIYLSNESDILNSTDLEEIKNILIKDKKVVYLAWLDGNSNNYYPSKEICIKNSIFNDITILKRKVEDEDQILIRLKNSLNFQTKEIKNYLKILSEEQELIFDGKYKTIIYKFNPSDYKQIKENDYSNIYHFIQDILKVQEELNSFSKEFHQPKHYINFFYKMFFRNKENYYPLIPHDLFSQYFLKEDGTYNIRNEENYLKNILDLIHQSKFSLIENDESMIFSDFIESFFPNNISGNYNKFNFFKIFSDQVNGNFPKTIFDLDELLIQTICKYLGEKKNNIFDVLSLYLSFNRLDKQYILFDCDFDVDDSNFESFLNTIMYAINHNNNLYDMLANKLDNIKALQSIEGLSQLQKRTLDYEVNEDDYEVNLDGEIVDIKTLEYVNIENDELNFIEVTGDKLASLKNSTLFIFNNEEKYQIIIAPLVLLKSYSIIKNRRKLFKKNEETYLFKPHMSLDDLKQIEYFDDAINVLDNHYKYSEIFNSNPKREKHLLDWLRCFKKDEDIKAVLCVIAKHKYFLDEEVNNFIDGIKRYKDANEYLITNIKNVEDNNGIHRLFNLKQDENLFRECKSQGLVDFTKIFLESDNDKLVFMVDNIISGGQIKNAFQNYYLKDDFDIFQVEQNEYHSIDENDFKTFKKKFLNLKEIVFLSIFYTIESKEKIETCLREKGYSGDINFIGFEKEYKELIFDGIIESNEKETFKAIAQNREFIEDHFNINKISFTEVKDNDEKFNKRNILVRYSSTPNKRFFIFTQQPKYYSHSLFQYKSDKR